MNKPPRILSSVALASLVFWPALAAAGPVDVVVPAMPLEKAVRLLSQATGKRLEVSRELAGEVLVASASKVEPDELLARVASCLGATWRDDGSKLTLVLTDAQRKEQRDAELAWRQRAAEAAIQKLSEPLAKHPTFDAKAIEEARQGGGVPAMGGGGFSPMAMAQLGRNLIAGNPASPTGRAVARLARLIGPKTLAMLGDGERLVFSTRPNAMQRPFPNGSLPILNQLIAEQAKWAEANNAVNDEAGMERLLGALFGGTRTAVAGSPSKALLAVQRQRLTDGYEFRLTLFDQEGKEAFSDGLTMLLESSPLNLLDSLGAATAPGQEIRLSPLSAKLLGVLRGLSSIALGVAPSAAIDDELAAVLRRPDEYEPLSFFHGEAFAAVAQAYGRNLVACVPDAAFSASLFLLPGQKLTVESFLKSLQDLKLMSLESDDRWIVARPTRPWYQRMQRQDRRALAGLIASVRSDGTLRLADLAAYALGNPPLLENPVASLYATLSLPGLAANPSAMQWDLLRFFGSMTASQRQMALNGAEIPLRSLTSNQRAMVWRMAYLPGFLGMSGLRVQTQQPANPFAALRTEPTELLPNGIPGGAFVRVTVQRTQVVVNGGASPAGGLRLFSALGAEELGAMQQLREDPALGAMVGAFLPNWQTFRVGEKLQYQFLFQLTPEVSLTGMLEDVEVPEGAPAVPFDRLPQAFRERVQRTREQMKQGAAQLGSILGGGQAPPRP